MMFVRIAGGLAAASPLAMEGIMRVFSLRAAFILTFVAAMPVLALPPVSRWMDDVLYGAPSADFAEPPAAPVSEALPPIVAERVAPVGFEGPGPAAGELASPAAPPLAAIDVHPPAPPPLPQSPSFAPPTSTSLEQPARAIGAETIARLQQIRQRLEDLGADYVVVETTSGSGQYRFHCRMTVDKNTNYTRPFEALSTDPLAAGEAVLRAVETWRSAATSSAM
jgi:hypothetical protein